MVQAAMSLPVTANGALGSVDGSGKAAGEDGWKSDFQEVELFTSVYPVFLSLFNMKNYGKLHSPSWIANVID